MEYDKEQLTESFQYLDDLRESGLTNMWGSSSYVERDLGYSHREALDVVALWMDSFDGSPVDERVEKIMNQA